MHHCGRGGLCGLDGDPVILIDAEAILADISEKRRIIDNQAATIAELQQQIAHLDAQVARLLTPPDEPNENEQP